MGNGAGGANPIPPPISTPAKQKNKQTKNEESRMAGSDLGWVFVLGTFSQTNTRRHTNTHTHTHTHKQTNKQTNKQTKTNYLSV